MKVYLAHNGKPTSEQDGYIRALREVGHKQFLYPFSVLRGQQELPIKPNHNARLSGHIERR